MARKFLALAIALSALIPAAALAQSGCGGQGASGSVCGNADASTGLPSLGTVTGLLDRAMGSAQGRVLQRGGGGWAASPNPTLGVNGSVGGALTLNGSTSGSATIRVPAAAGGVIFQLPANNGTAGYVLVTDGAGNLSWQNNAAGGTVQSVGLSMPGIFSVSGSPVTLTGTLTATLATQSANLVWAGPTSGGAATPTFRSLVGADLPNPSASTLGGVQSFAAVSSQWIRQISTSGVPTASQPAFTDISGTLAAAQCPTPTASTIGCVQSLTSTASRWINAISTAGVPSTSQPAFSDLSGAATLAQLPSISTSSVLGNNSGGTAVPSALTATQVLDFIGSTQGQVLYRNASAWVTLSPGTSGQVLTTGGAGANPAWATVTGTGTVTNVATGTGLTGGPITTTGTIEFATIANQRILANVSGGVAAPSANTLSSVLDIAGSTTGNILYRAGGGWTVLAPGTNGQVLTMGASTPAWGSAGTVSNVTISAGTGISTSGTCNISTTGTCTVTNSGVTSIAGNTGAFTLGGGITNSTNQIKLALNNATAQTSGANPTGTTSVTAVMMGLGGSCTLTPVYSSRVYVEFRGGSSNTSAAAANVFQAKYGTGAAPSNGAANTGTTIGAATRSFPGVASTEIPFNTGGIVTGLSPGTAYWFDLNLLVGAGTGTLATVACSLMEF